jgi:hypothetical protein
MLSIEDLRFILDKVLGKFDNIELVLRDLNETLREINESIREGRGVLQAFMLCKRRISQKYKYPLARVRRGFEEE